MSYTKDSPAIRQLQDEINASGYASAEIVGFGDEGEFSAAFKVFEITDEGLDTKRYGGMEEFIAFSDIESVF